MLVAILGDEERVYYQPPPSIKLQHPCIVYERDRPRSDHADNRPYLVHEAYQVTYMDHMPDSDVIDKLQAVPTSEHQRHFAVAGLNHDVFVIYP